MKEEVIVTNHMKLCKNKTQNGKVNLIQNS